MFNFVANLVQSAAPKVVVCAHLMAYSPDIGYCENTATTVITPKPHGAMPMSRIAQMAETYLLVSGEIEQLTAIVRDYPEEDPYEMLTEMLKCILGDRRLRTIKPLSVETIDRARKAVEEGYTQFVLQDVD